MNLLKFTQLKGQSQGLYDFKIQSLNYDCMPPLVRPTAPSFPLVYFKSPTFLRDHPSLAGLCWETTGGAWVSLWPPLWLRFSITVDIVLSWRCCCVLILKGISPQTFIFFISLPTPVPHASQKSRERLSFTTEVIAYENLFFFKLRNPFLNCQGK